MNTSKIRSKSHIVGELGVDILKRHFPVEWVVREYHPDYGLDLSVEIFERGDPAITTGAHVFFQVKGTETIKSCLYKVKSRSNVEKPPEPVEKRIYEVEAIKFVLDTSFLATVERMGSGVPVLLALVDISTEIVYFVCLSDYIEKILIHDGDYKKQKNKTIYIPIGNVISEATLPIIEWYARRPRFYALFNKINYQKRELKYVDEYHMAEYIDHFIRILYRFDVWKPPYMVTYMEEDKEEMDYYIEHGITKSTAEICHQMEENGINLDAKEWIGTGFYSHREVSQREIQRIHGLHELWRKLTILGDIFEEDSKEMFLPTAFWAEHLLFLKLYNQT